MTHISNLFPNSGALLAAVSDNATAVEDAELFRLYRALQDATLAANEAAARDPEADMTKEDELVTAADLAFAQAKANTPAGAALKLAYLCEISGATTEGQYLDTILLATVARDLASVVVRKVGGAP